MSNKNTLQLHLLRGLAALYVAMGHCKVMFWVGGREYMARYPRSGWSPIDYLAFGMDMLTSAAQEFVIVFFVLSGFFISRSFMLNQWRFIDFVKNRVVRIYPPYLASVLLSLFAIGVAHHWGRAIFEPPYLRLIDSRIAAAWAELSIVTVLKSLIFLPTNDYVACNFSYWSLFHEWLFYLLFPLFVLSRVRLLLSLALYIVGIWYCPQENQLLLSFLLRYQFYFFVGIATHEFITRGQFPIWMQQQHFMRLGAVFCGFMTIALGAANYSEASALFAIAFAVWAMITLYLHPFTDSWLVQIFNFLGNVSYSLYIIHLPIYLICYTLLVHFTHQRVYYSRIYWCFIPVAIFAAWLMYLFVEQKTLDVIRQLKKKKVS